MIRSKKELKFYYKADMMMNTGQFKYSLIDTMKNLLLPNYIIKYLRAMRRIEYYTNKNGILSKATLAINAIYYKRLAIKLGFSISSSVFGYGLVIPHYGTIVVGAGNKIGNYAVLHTSTCITAGKKQIGNAFYLSAGAKVLNDIKLGDNVSVGANAIVNKSFEESNCLLVGIPAIKIKDTEPWYKRDGEEYIRRVYKCEELKRNMGLSSVEIE
jgi:serine O-acetyltransferase